MADPNQRCEKKMKNEGVFLLCQATLIFFSLCSGFREKTALIYVIFVTAMKMRAIASRIVEMVQ